MREGNFIKKTFFLVFIVLITFFIAPISTKANWLDDWYEKTGATSTNTDFDYFSGQKRGYATFGSFSLRIPTQTDYLFSIEKPRLKVGCGGIDIFLGGFSFLDSDYLVEKVQRMLQAAPFIAFDIALSTITPQISESLKKVEALIDQLNQIQLSECGIYVPRAVVNAAKNPFSLFKSQTEKSAEVASKKGETSMWKQFFDRYVHVTDSGEPDIEGVSSQEAVAGLPKYFRDWLIEVASGNEEGFITYLVSIGKVDEEVGKIFRAYVGDIYAKANTDGTIFNIEYGSPCGDVSIKDALADGTIWEAEDPLLNGNMTVCYSYSATRVFEDVKRTILEAYEAAKNRQAPPAYYEEIVRVSPIPVYLFVKYAVLSKDDRGTILESIAPQVAQGIIYAGLLDLCKEMRSVLGKIKYSSHYSVGNGTAGIELLPKFEEAYESFSKRLSALESSVRELYATSLKEVTNSINQAMVYMKFMDIVERNLGVSFIMGLGEMK